MYSLTIFGLWLNAMTEHEALQIWLQSPDVKLDPDGVSIRAAFAFMEAEQVKSCTVYYDHQGELVIQYP